MVDRYSFGIEIEVIAEPRAAQGVQNPHNYYQRLATALEARGLKAGADDLSEGYRKHTEEYDKRWWITRDGSLSSSNDSDIKYEAVSRILYTSKDWEGEIDKFWEAQDTVFHMPKKSTSCGSHVHISPDGKWSKKQLKDIAVGVAAYEKYIYEMLPNARRDNEYCQRNTVNSPSLGRHYSEHDGWNGLIPAMRSLDRAGVISMMQTNRKVLWNFEPVADSGIGTVEFRGGRCLSGPVRTKRWIAFAISFIHFLLEQAICTRDRFPDINSAAELYERIRSSAAHLDLRRHLPRDMNLLNETCQTRSASPAPATPRSWFSTVPNESPPAYTLDAALELDHTTSHESSRDTTGCLPERGSTAAMIHDLVRFLQFVAAITVVGIYGHAIALAISNGHSVHPRLTFATLVAVASAIIAFGTAVTMGYRYGTSLRVWSLQWIPDGFLSFLWLIVFAVFGARYIPQGGAGNLELYNSVWLDLFNLFLWIMTALARFILVKTGYGG